MKYSKHCDVLRKCLHPKVYHLQNWWCKNFDRLQYMGSVRSFCIASVYALVSGAQYCATDGRPGWVDLPKWFICLLIRHNLSTVRPLGQQPTSMLTRWTNDEIDSRLLWPRVWAPEPRSCPPSHRALTGSVAEHSHDTRCPTHLVHNTHAASVIHCVNEAID